MVQIDYSQFYPQALREPVPPMLPQASQPAAQAPYRTPDELVQYLMNNLGMTQEEAQNAAAAIELRGGIGSRMDELDERAVQAQALRRQQGPGGRAVGGVYVAANPLEHLATALGRYGGARMEREVKAGREQAREDLQRADRAAAGVVAREGAVSKADRAAMSRIQQAQFAALLRSRGYDPQGMPLPPQADAPATAPTEAATGVTPSPTYPMGGVGADAAPVQGPPVPVGRPVPQINPQIDVLRQPYQPGTGRRGSRTGGGQAFTTPVPHNMRRRPFAGAGYTGPTRPPSYGPFMNEGNRSPYGGQYPWPERW